MEVASVVAVQAEVLRLKLLVEQTNSLTVSAVPVTSASEAVELKTTASPGNLGESSEKAVKVGRWFTLKGEEVVPVPCLYVALQRGFTGSSSQIQAYQSFDSAIASVVVVEVVTTDPLVPLATAHCVVVAEQSGAAVPSEPGPAAALGVGGTALSQMRRK